MGMGYAGNFAVTIEEKDLAKQVPAEFKTFDNARKALGNMFEEFARQVSLDDVDKDEAGFAEMQLAYEILCEAFKAKAGIGLCLGFHNQDDEGDRYDDIGGVYWSLFFDHCFTYTPAYLKLKKACKGEIRIQHFVTFG